MYLNIYHMAADFIVVLHFLFVFFVVLGGLVGLWKPKLLWLHLPALIWGVLVEFTGWICPLTPLENLLRQKGGGIGYGGGFIEHLIMPILYPAGLTRHIQILLGSAVILINLIIYSTIIRRHILTRNRKII
jgi:hypothetical protein